MTSHRAIMMMVALGFLAACSLNEGVAPEAGQDKRDRRMAEMGSIFGGDGMLALGGGNDGGAALGGIAVNGYLWRASLDTISFLPILQVDVQGGVIITDWHALPESPNERYKMTVYVLDRELRADGIRVALFKQLRQADGSWVDAPVTEGAPQQIENAILTRARQLRIDSRALLDN